MLCFKMEEGGSGVVGGGNHSNFLVMQGYKTELWSLGGSKIFDTQPSQAAWKTSHLETDGNSCDSFANMDHKLIKRIWNEHVTH